MIDLSRPVKPERTFAHALVSIAGAAGLALIAPFAILLVGMPVALAVRGLVEALQWISTALR